MSCAIGTLYYIIFPHALYRSFLYRLNFLTEASFFFPDEQQKETNTTYLFLLLVSSLHFDCFQSCIIPILEQVLKMLCDLAIRNAIIQPSRSSQLLNANVVSLFSFERISIKNIFSLLEYDSFGINDSMLFVFITLEYTSMSEFLFL